MIFLIRPNPYLIQSPASQDDAELVLSHCSFSHFGGISGQHGIPMFEEFQPDQPLDFDLQILRYSTISTSRKVDQQILGLDDPGCTRNFHHDSYRLNQKLHHGWSHKCQLLPLPNSAAVRLQGRNEGNFPPEDGRWLEGLRTYGGEAACDCQKSCHLLYLVLVRQS